MLIDTCIEPGAKIERADIAVARSARKKTLNETFAARNDEGVNGLTRAFISASIWATVCARDRRPAPEKFVREEIVIAATKSVCAVVSEGETNIADDSLIFKPGGRARMAEG